MEKIQHLKNTNDIARLYYSLNLIREVEKRVAQIYPSDKIKSPVHLSIGQEAISVGICEKMKCDDFVVGTYRGHALYLAKDGDLNKFMAELYGKADGCAAGKGGSMHLIDMSKNILGGSAVVATNIPIALGYAWKLKQDDKKRIIACFFGDGATEEGVFYESLNFASLHNLPILFVCENNGMAIHTGLEKRWSSEDLNARVSSFNIKSHSLETMDIFEIGNIAETAITRIRAGKGPEFLECHTFRWCEHVGPGEDFDKGYRSKDELNQWQDNDQVNILGQLLRPEEKTEIDSKIQKKISEAVYFAESSPFPKSSELMRHVYAE